jgi:hypothetical protein
MIDGGAIPGRCGMALTALAVIMIGGGMMAAAAVHAAVVGHDQMLPIAGVMAV